MRAIKRLNCVISGRSTRLRFVPRLTLIGIFCALAAVGVMFARMGRASSPRGHFSISDGTVADSKTLLTWQQAVPTTMVRWPDAVVYCSTLNLGGWSSGWRLPSFVELETLIDDSRWNPATDIVAFPNTPVDAYYWTASTFSVDPNSAWTLDFAYGITQVYLSDSSAYYTLAAEGKTLATDEMNKLSKLRVRCVHD
jgi:formylglycine-generating enzyme required for sulfatase activity